MTAPKLTDEEYEVLVALSKAVFLIPSEIGYVMTTGRQYPLKPQGAGRVGGGMARRLMVKGLVDDASFLRGGFPAYRITGKGLKALKAAP